MAQAAHPLESQDLGGRRQEGVMRTEGQALKKMQRLLSSRLPGDSSQSTLSPIVHVPGFSQTRQRVGVGRLSLACGSTPGAQPEHCGVCRRE